MLTKGRPAQGVPAVRQAEAIAAAAAAVITAQVQAAVIRATVSRIAAVRAIAEDIQGRIRAVMAGLIITAGAVTRQVMVRAAIIAAAHRQCHFLLSL